MTEWFELHPLDCSDAAGFMSRRDGDEVGHGGFAGGDAERAAGCEGAA